MHCPASKTALPVTEGYIGQDGKWVDGIAKPYSYVKDCGDFIEVGVLQTFKRKDGLSEFAATAYSVRKKLIKQGDYAPFGKGLPHAVFHEREIPRILATN